MLKKIFLSICAIVVIAYLSLWAWAVHWIERQENAGLFISDKKNMTLEIAKTIWQITPAIDRNKDAERALKISSFSVYTNLPLLEKDLPKLIENLKINHNFIYEYYKKHENKLDDRLKGKFLLQRLIFINRSWKNIKGDTELFDEVFKIIQHIPTNVDLDLVNVENRIDWFPEIVWLLYFENGKDTNIYNKFLGYLKKDLKTMNEKNNTNAFYGILLFHHASILCYEQNKEKDLQKKKELDEESGHIFKLIEKEITHTDKEKFKIFVESIIGNNSNYLIIPPMTLSPKTECTKEVRNLLSKINDVANILDNEQ